MKTYTGGCHCGAVAFSVSIEDINKSITCNCSHCHMKGFVLASVGKDAFTLERGEESLTDYHFGKKMIRHRFCKVCGVQSFAEGIAFPGMVVNLRCLKDVDIDTLSPERYNGKDL